MASGNSKLPAEDMTAFDLACDAIFEAGRALERLLDDPSASLAALAKAEHNYDLCRVEWLRCRWRLTLAAADALPGPSQAIGAVVIIGRDKAVRDSLRVLLNVKGYGRSKALGFDSWQEVWLDRSELIIIDVPVFSVATPLWFIGSFETAIQKPHFIALARPEEAAVFAGKVDAVVAKPVVFDELFRAIEQIKARTEAQSLLE